MLGLSYAKLSYTFAGSGICKVKVDLICFVRLGEFKFGLVGMIWRFVRQGLVVSAIWMLNLIFVWLAVCLTDQKDDYPGLTWIWVKLGN